ncbi:MAG: hypothetical protein ACK4MQ_10825 [Hyphomonas sp.]
MYTAEAAAMLRLSPRALASFVKTRGWETEKCPKNRNFVTLDRATVEAEAARREERRARAPRPIEARPADRAIAERCARQIRAYWRERGHNVTVEVFGADIVSDLVNGLPVRR